MALVCTVLRVLMESGHFRDYNLRHLESQHWHRRLPLQGRCQGGNSKEAQNGCLGRISPWQVLQEYLGLAPWVLRPFQLPQCMSWRALKVVCALAKRFFTSERFAQDPSMAVTREMFYLNRIQSLLGNEITGKSEPHYIEV